MSADKSVSVTAAPPRSILRKSSSFSVPNGGSLVNMTISSGELGCAPSRAIAIPTSGRARGGDSVASGSSASGSPAPVGESFLNAKIRGETHAGSVASGSKAFFLMNARDQRGVALAPEAPDEDDKWGPSLESSPDAPGGDEAEGRVRRGEALKGLESPLHELLERNREDADRPEASISSMFNSIDSGSALDLIDEVTESDDIPPLPTPEVSKHGTNEAWLFMGQSQRHHRRFSDTGDTDGSGPEESDDRVASSSSRPGSRGHRMRHSSSVVSFSEEHKIHDIGSVSDLAKEKKVKTKTTMMSSLKGELKALMVNYGMKAEKPKDAPVIDGLKDSRKNMFENINNTIAVNENRAAWETRELSLRGGNEYGKMMEQMRRTSSSPDFTTLDADKRDG
jgi:hypothetical protein